MEMKEKIDLFAKIVLDRDPSLIPLVMAQVGLSVTSQAPKKIEPTKGCIGCDFIVNVSPDQRGYCQIHGDINGGPDDE